MEEVMPVKSYKDLLVWQKGMQLAGHIYDLTSRFPKHELYGIIGQMQRAVISIPANIAEGHARNSTKEFLHFLSISRGSLAELETFLALSVQLKYCQEKDTQPILHLCDEISRMLNGLRNKLKEKGKRIL
jgi:four helix bundle protein